MDNTNVKKWEMSVYKNIAAENNYSVLILEPKTPWSKDANQLKDRSTHSVSLEIIKKKVI